MRGSIWAQQRLAALSPAVLLWVGVAVAGMVLAGAALTAGTMSHNALLSAERTTASMASLLAGNAEHDIEAMVHGLRRAKQALRASALVDGRIDAAAASRVLREQAQQGPALLRLSVVDDAGIVVAASSPSPSLGASLADRDVILGARGAANDALVFGQRTAAGATGDPSFGIALRLADPRTGAYVGAVAIEVASSTFESDYAAVARTDPLRATLALEDGRVLAGPPAPDGTLVPLAARWREGPGEQSVQRVSLVTPDGRTVEQLLAIRRVPGVPMFVAVELDLASALAPWRARIAVLAGWAGVAAVTLLALALSAALVARRARRLDDDLQTSRSRYEALVENSPAGIALLRGGRIVYANPALTRVAGVREPADLQGRDIADFVDSPENGDAARATLGGRPERLVRTELWMRPQQGSPFEVETIMTPALAPDDDTVQLMVHDISARKRAEARLRESEERYRVLVTGMPDCAVLLLTPQAIIDDVSPDAETTLLGPRARLLGRPLSALLAHDGPADARVLLSCARTSGSIERDGWLARTDGTLFWGHMVLSPMQHAAAGLHGWHVVVRDISWRKRLQEQIDEHLQRAQELSSAVEAARENEKLHFARELHDGLGQALGAMKLDLDRLDASLPADAEDARARAQALRRMLLETVAVTRRIASDLRPLVLDDLGLEAALEWLVEQFRARHATFCRLALRGSPVQALPATVSTALFRIAQECLTNVSRHAQATSAAVELHFTGEAVQLTVRDDGRGFVPERGGGAHGGFGLMGIRERVRRLGGTLEIDSRAGGGTRITVCLPLAPAPRPEPSRREEQQLSEHT